VPYISDRSVTYISYFSQFPRQEPVTGIGDLFTGNLHHLLTFSHGTSAHHLLFNDPFHQCRVTTNRSQIPVTKFPLFQKNLHPFPQNGSVENACEIEDIEVELSAWGE
jgi:hypothetical protein